VTTVLPWLEAVVDTASIPPEGRRIALDAGQEARAIIAERLAVPDVLSCAATCTVRPREGALAEIRLELTARLVRNCVVTGEPMEEEVAESFDSVIVAEEPDLDPEDELDDVDYEVAPDGKIDLAELAVQQFAVAMTPYPRSSGADAALAEAAPVTAARETPENPFAGLADRLNKPGGGADRQ